MNNIFIQSKTTFDFFIENQRESKIRRKDADTFWIG